MTAPPSDAEDIVKRLRNRNIDNGTDFYWRYDDDITEAADTIAALRAVATQYRERAESAERERAALRKDVAHWIRMFECAQNANALRQSAMSGEQQK